MRVRSLSRDPKFPLRAYGRLFERALQAMIDEGQIDSHREFAQRNGYHPQSISDYVLGHSIAGSDDDRRRLAVAAGVAVGELEHAERLDRLDSFRRSLGCTVDELLALAKEIRKLA